MPGKMKPQQAATYAMATSARGKEHVVQANCRHHRDAGGNTNFSAIFAMCHTLMHHVYASASRYESCGSISARLAYRMALLRAVIHATRLSEEPLKGDLS